MSGQGPYRRPPGVPSFPRSRALSLRVVLGALALVAALVCLALWPLPTLAYGIAGLLFFVGPWFIVRAPERT